jgi:hypothetical protein
MPSLALAQLLHHDAGRAEELEALKDAPARPACRALLVP